MYQRKRKLFKKSAAILTASSLVIAGTSTVFAAESYQEIEKEKLSVLTEAIAESWDQSIEEYDTVRQGAKGDFSLHLEDAGRSILGLMVPVDVSWLDNIGMNMDISIEDAMEAVDGKIYVNDTDIGTIRVLMDLASMIEYIQIPEISESWLKTDLNANIEAMDLEEGMSEALEEMPDGTSIEIPTDESVKIYEEVMLNPEKFIPEGAVMEELLERYGTIVLEHMQEGPSINETISIDGVGQECTVYEGQIYEKDARALAEEVLTTAREDEQLKELLESWQELSETEDLYGEFQKAVEESLADIETEEEPSDTEYISSKIWVSDEGKIVGRQISFCEGIESTPAFTWKQPRNGNAVGFLVEIGDADSSFAVSGSGETQDGKMHGTYNLVTDGVVAAIIDMENYDTEGAKEGNVNGTFKLSFPQGAEEEAEYNPLANFNFVLNITSDKDASSSETELTIMSAGVSLGSLKLTAFPGEGTEIPDMEKVGTLYDLSNDEDMETYSTELNFQTILENALSAGVPEDLVTQIDIAIQSALSGESAEYNLEEDGELPQEEAVEEEAAQAGEADE